MSEGVRSLPAGRADIVDLHSHWFSPAAVELLSRIDGAPRIARDADGAYALHRAGPGSNGVAFPLGSHWFDIDHRLRHLDAAGVAHQLISWPTTLNVDAVHGAADWRPLWSAYNDDLASLVRAHPHRFSAVAALSTQDIAWSVKELERAHEKLGLIGAVLPVNGFFTTASAQAFAPIFEVAQRYGSHIYLHTGYASPNVPGQPPLVDHADNQAVRWVLDSSWHFASAVATLAFGPFLEAYPDVTVQIAMLGGAGFAALVAEQAQLGAQRTGITDVRARFRQIWLDTGAAGSGPAAIAAAIRVLGADRIVFGSDFAPVPAVPPIIENVLAAVTSRAEADAVFHNNARSLLERFGVNHFAAAA
jgi:predicted TIM-barrel fold metal-dependent hydrolase